MVVVNLLLKSPFILTGKIFRVIRRVYDHDGRYTITKLKVYDHFAKNNDSAIESLRSSEVYDPLISKPYDHFAEGIRSNQFLAKIV